jgi:hypothetical protein
MTIDELETPMNMPMEEIDALPEFFQTSGREIVWDTLEDLGEETVDTEYVLEDDIVEDDVAFENTDENILIGEQVTHSLLNFFEGVSYEDLGDVFRSFEFGDTWLTNPIFSDEFAFCCLPTRLYQIVTNLHHVLHIRAIIPERTRDLRYSSLSEPQQIQLRQLIHANTTKYNQLDDIYNQLNGFLSRTESYQVKFLLKKTLEVVEDILHKNIEE